MWHQRFFKVGISFNRKKSFSGSSGVLKLKFCRGRALIFMMLQDNNNQEVEPSLNHGEGLVNRCLLTRCLFFQRLEVTLAKYRFLRNELIHNDVSDQSKALRNWERTSPAKTPCVSGRLVVRVRRIRDSFGGCRRLCLLHCCVRRSSRRDTRYTVAHLNGRWHSPIGCSRAATQSKSLVLYIYSIDLLMLIIKSNICIICLEILLFIQLEEIKNQLFIVQEDYFVSLEIK